MSNLRFAFRQLLKSPGFTATAILTLAIAIAVNATVFAVMRVVLYQPVTPAHPEEVTGIFSNRPTARGNDYRRLSHAEYTALRGATDLFRDVSAVHPTLVGVGEGAEARRSLSAIVSENFFSFHGVAVVAGRPFTSAECQPGAAQNVVVASHAYWQRIGGRPDFLGSRLRIGGQTFTVVGISPPKFSGLNALIIPDFYFPLGAFSQLGGGLVGELAAGADLANPQIYSLSVQARFAPGITLVAAKTRLPALTARVQSVAPPLGEEATGATRVLEFGAQQRFGISDAPDTESITPALGAVLQGMAVLVLLVASLNLANLLLARGAVRRREIAVRMAVGASRGHIVRQLLAEGAVLACLGGLLGAILGSLGMQGVIVSLLNNVGQTSFAFSPAFDARPDGWVTLAVGALCAGATLVFSLGPALSLSKRELALDMRTGGGPDGVDRRGWRALFGSRSLLVTAQLALALALLFTATQFFRGGVKLATRSPGFTVNGIAIMEVDYALARVPKKELAMRFADLQRRIQHFPGIQSAVWASLVPFDNKDTWRRAVALGPQAAEPPAGKAPGAYGMYTSVDAGYFQQLGIPVVAGREFTRAESDLGDAPRAAIVDEKLAHRLFADGIAVGRRVRVGEADRASEYEIVGVVRSPWHDFAGDEPPARLYLPFAQDPGATAFLQLKVNTRDRAALSGLLQTIRREMAEWDRSALVLQATSLEDFVAHNATLWVLQSTAAMFGIFALMALVLAVVGVYGVAAYLVSRRTREIGIRMALGATARAVLNLVLGQSARQAFLAVGMGAGLAIGLARLLASQLTILPPVDVFSLGACGAFLFAAAVLAGFPPARRAARIQPSVALKSE